MKPIISFFIKYPIWANVFMGSIMIFGFFSMGNIRTSFFPESDPNRIIINLSYPGTSPEEIERGLIIKIEKRLKGISGIDYTTSTARENSGSINITTTDRADVDEVLEEVKSAVDAVFPWPEGAEQAKITKSQFTMPVIIIALSGTMDLWTLKQRAEELEEDLINTEGVSDINIRGLPNREIAITISNEDLQRYGLTFTQVVNAVKNANIDISGGKIETESDEILIRAYQKAANTEHIRNIILSSDASGALVRVGDVASVIEKWEDTPAQSFYNGKRAVYVTINQMENEDLLEVAEKSLTTIAAFRQKYPDLSLDKTFDSTISLRERIRMLTNNGLIGLGLVLITLTFFLNLRVAFWVAIGLPLSFAGMFIIASMVGITFNILSLFGMIVVVGILVDDAIVVAEQTYQGVEQGMVPSKAALWGVNTVIAPVFTAVLTSILAFVPFFFFEGRMGKMVWELALVVVAALIFSLLESFFILPSHLAHSQGIRITKANPIRRAVDASYRWLTHQVYGKLLRLAMTYKLLSVALVLTILAISLGMVWGGIVKINPFPDLDRDDISINVTLTSGTQEKITMKVLQDLEQQVRAFDQNQMVPQFGKLHIKAYSMNIGSNGLGDIGSHCGRLEMSLIGPEERTVKSTAIKRMLRGALKVPTSAQKFSFSEGHWGKAITINLSGKDFEQLKKAEQLTKEELSQYASLKDIVDSDVEGPREIRLQMKPKAHALGLSHMEIASQVRQAFYGTEIQRIQRGEDEIKIKTRYREADRNSIGQLENMIIKTRTGQQIPLRELMSIEIGRGLAAIKHRDGKREIKIEADLANPAISTSEVVNEIKTSIFPILRQKVPQVQFNLGGRERHNQNFSRSLINSYTPALLAIFVILILVFRSKGQAVLIILMIPLGIIGIVWGHFINGIMITRMSTFGIIALTGIVINDSIVFIDKINVNIRAGMNIFEAIYEAGINRLRPILMTTITTVIGLAPIMLEGSFQAQFVIPMAVSVAWGMIFGSVLILFMVPCYFLVLNDLRFYLTKIENLLVMIYTGKKEPAPTRESVEPAYIELHHFNGEAQHE